MNHCFYAKYALISILLGFLVYTGCTTATPRLFQNDTYLRSSEKYYKITLLAYGPGTLIEGKKSKAGHASLSIERSGVWGFYPRMPGKLITAHGILKYSAEYPRAREYADFFVDEGIMNKIFELIAEWENNPPAFIVPFNDCVSFIYRICDITGLRYNNLKLFPASAICEIRNLNNQNHLYTSKQHKNKIFEKKYGTARRLWRAASRWFFTSDNGTVYALPTVGRPGLRGGEKI